MSAAWPLIGFYMDNATIRDRREDARWRMRARLATVRVQMHAERKLVDLHGSSTCGRLPRTIANELTALADEITDALTALAEGVDPTTVMARVPIATDVPEPDMESISTAPFTERIQWEEVA